MDLDEDISKYLGFKVMNPKYPNDLITLRMVMTQTSSITDDGAFIDGMYKGYDGSNSCDDYITLEDLLTPGSDRFYKGYSDYKPGSTFIYSNLGCGILACVIERITGKYFPEYIKEELLHPLGIYSGFRLEDIKDIENLVTHYRFENGKFIKHRYYETFKKVQCLKYPLGDNFRGVAGGLYISAYDLSKIMFMLMNKGQYNNIRILKESTVNEMEKVAAHELKLRDKLFNALSKIPYSAINGDKDIRLPNNFNMCFEGIEGESLLLLLDDAGICASSGSACTSGSLDPSHVLLAIGRPHEVAHGSLRLSLSKYTTQEEIEYVISKVPEVVDYLRNMSPVWDQLKKGVRKHVL